MEIETYSFGKIKINGTSYTEDVILFPNRIKSNWRREKGHTLKEKDLEEVWEAKPDVLIIGRGAYGRMQPTPSVFKRADKEDIELISKETKEACRIYNQKKEEGRVIAALHITC